MAPWLAKVETQITCFAALEPGWDSYGARAISEDARQRALELARSTAGLPWLLDLVAVPTSVGGVQLEYHGRGIEFEASVDPEAPSVDPEAP